MEKKFRFKAGDEVVIVKNKGDKNLDKCVGRKVKIQRVNECKEYYPYLITIDGSSSWWSNTELELVEEELKVGDKVFIKSEEFKKHTELYYIYKHLEGKQLTVKSILDDSRYSLLEVEPYRKWTGIGINGSYVSKIPVFTIDILEKVELDESILDARMIDFMNKNTITLSGGFSGEVKPSIHDFQIYNPTHPTERDKDELVNCILERYRIRIEDYQNIIIKNEDKYNDLAHKYEQLKGFLTDIREIADKKLD